MKLILLFVSVVSSLSAWPELAFFGVHGPRSVFPGQTAYLTPDHAWIEASEFTVDPEANLVTVPAHTLKNGDVIRVFSPDGAVPHPLNPLKTYTIRDAAENTFRLVEFNGAPIIDFTGTGSGRLLLGPKINHKTHVYLEPFDTRLEGVSIDCMCTADRVTNRFYSYFGWVPVTLQALVAPDAPPNSTILKWKVSADGVPPQTIEVPFSVRAIPDIGKLRPSEFPPIPGKAKWESTMLKVAERWCKDPSNPSEKMGFGVESQVWYYDGAWVYYQIAEYTGDPKWNNCARHIVSQYLEYVLANEGRISGYRIFVDGLARAAREDPEPYHKAIENVALNSPFSRSSGSNSDAGIRETAFLLEAQVMYERITGKEAPGRARTVDRLLGMFDNLYVSETPVLHQTFMDGLAMRALIRYYELTQDDRIPPAMRTALDWIWDRAWKNDTKKLFYSPNAYGPVCLSGCLSPNTDLINLVAPAYAWYWSITSDDLYRQRGDEMFAHALDTDISYSGKIFSQNYRWSFDYIRWREGLEPFQP